MPELQNKVHGLGRTPTVAVIGASLSGLVCAFELSRQGHAVTLFEATDRTGGQIQTVRSDDHTYETSPWAHLSLTPTVSGLLNHLNLQDRIIYWNSLATLPAILRNGKLHEFPASAFQYLTTGLWSVGGKLRLLREPFITPQNPGLNADESAESFLTRRFGREVYQYGFEPLVRGRLGGNGSAVSASATFPALVRHEEKSTSIIRGMLSGTNTPPTRPCTFAGSLSVLTDSLTAILGESVLLNCRVLQVIPMRAGRTPVYHVSYDESGTKQTEQFDRVVYATNASDTAEIIRPIDPETAAALREIVYAPLINVYCSFRRESLSRIPEEPGLIIPATERMNMLSAEWVGNLQRSTPESASWDCNVLLGGIENAELLEKPDEEIVKIVTAELHDIIGINSSPLISAVTKIPLAIPQYAVGYNRIVKMMDRFEANFAGSYMCASYRNGQALTAQMEEGTRVARQLARQE